MTNNYRPTNKQRTIRRGRRELKKWLFDTFPTQIYIDMRMYIHVYVFDQAYKDNDNTFLIMILNSGLRGREFLTFFPLKNLAALT